MDIKGYADCTAEDRAHGCVECLTSAEDNVRLLQKELRETKEKWYASNRCIQRLEAEVAQMNTPHTKNFLEAVRLEAAHQHNRWTLDHDAGKAPQDWFWLLGYLSGKALAAALSGNTAKALHHTISSAAVLLNWHAHISRSVDVSSKSKSTTLEDK